MYLCTVSHLKELSRVKSFQYFDVRKNYLPHDFYVYFEYNNNNFFIFKNLQVIPIFKKL